MFDSKPYKQWIKTFTPIFVNKPADADKACNNCSILKSSTKMLLPREDKALQIILLMVLVKIVNQETVLEFTPHVDTENRKWPSWLQDIFVSLSSNTCLPSTPG